MHLKMASRTRLENSNQKHYNIDVVQLEGLALLKMIKHCHEEGTGTTDVAQGVLLGLMVDNVLEVTNSFPFPRHSEDSDPAELPDDHYEYQLDMMRHLRKVNVDHISVGWYQSSQLGNFVTRTLIESQHSYQTSIEESVVIIYDPIKSSKGFLSVKAYRLTPEALNVIQEREYTADVLRKLRLGHDTLFQEIKVVLRNSHLVNTLMCELFEQMPGQEANQFLDLGSLSTLDRQMRCLMDSVDELSQEASKFNNFQRQMSKLQQDKHKYLLKRAVENQTRQSRGEPPLPEEDLNKLFKPIPPLPRLDATVNAGQIYLLCKDLNQFASQSLGKFFVAKSLQDQP